MRVMKPRQKLGVENSIVTQSLLFRCTDKQMRSCHSEHNDPRDDVSSHQGNNSENKKRNAPFGCGRMCNFIVIASDNPTTDSKVTRK